MGTGVGVWEFFDKESKYEFFFERGGGGRKGNFFDKLAKNPNLKFGQMGGGGGGGGVRLW